MRHTTAIVLTLALAPVPGVAQTEAQARAATALEATPVGALTPLLTPAMMTRRFESALLGVRYGLRSENGGRRQAFAASGILPLGMQSSVTLTAGVRTSDCSGVNCSPALMLGVGGDMRLYEAGDIAGGGSSMTLAVSGDLGYAKLRPGDDNAVAFDVGMPLTLSFGGANGGMLVAPYFVPMFGAGQTSSPCPITPGFSDCSKSGTVWAFGGGIGVWNRASDISASIGVTQVLLTDAKPVFGISVVLGGR